jgi:hypothetical protein
MGEQQQQQPATGWLPAQLSHPLFLPDLKLLAWLRAHLISLAACRAR